MQTYIAILRGINVGGKKIIKMTDLVKLFDNLGYFNIRTYIQSGNVIFEADDDKYLIHGYLEQSIMETFGFEVPLILISKNELQELIDKNPFIKNTISEIDNLHATFLNTFPDALNIKGLETIDFSPDKFMIIDKCLYLKCSGKYSDSKLTNTFIEKKLKVRATTRNWKTVMKLIELTDI